MLKRSVTAGLVALSIPLLGGAALAAAHSVSSTPPPAFVSHSSDQGDDHGTDTTLPSNATTSTLDDHGNDDPANHDVDDDNGVDDPATHDVDDDHDGTTETSPNSGPSANSGPGSTDDSSGHDGTDDGFGHDTPEDSSGTSGHG
jgi:hypothetical protein